MGGSRFLQPELSRPDTRQVASTGPGLWISFNLAAQRLAPLPVLSRFAGFLCPPAATSTPSFADYITPPEDNRIAAPAEPDTDIYDAFDQEIARTEKFIVATLRKLRSLWKSKNFWKPYR